MRLRKFLIIMSLLFCMVACGRKSHEVYLEKDGTLYEVADQVSFYYPKDFEINHNHENKQIIQFIR